jgi:hypothetical protein
MPPSCVRALTLRLLTGELQQQLQYCPQQLQQLQYCPQQLQLQLPTTTEA